MTKRPRGRPLTNESASGLTKRLQILLGSEHIGYIQTIKARGRIKTMGQAIRFALRDTATRMSS